MNQRRGPWTRGYRVRGRLVVTALAFAVVGAGAGADQMASSSRGRAALRSRNCLRCHSLDGSGGAAAADLGRRSLREQYTPAQFAAMMWNHGPELWRGQSGSSAAITRATQTEGDDLMAYFWGLRYFDAHGEAIRGKQVFEDKGCHGCHGLTSAEGVAGGPAVSQWRGLADPVEWAQRLWNHSAEMQRLLEARGLEWPKFSEREMIDLLVYLQNLEPKEPIPRRLELSAPDEGRTVFEAKGCVSCHWLGTETTAAAKIGGSLSGFTTMTGFTAEMWNHAPEMRARGAMLGVASPTFTVEEMRSLMSYLYFEGGFEESGSPSAGQSVYINKRCDSCHGQEGIRFEGLLGEGRASAARMAVAVWSHGPQMLDEMERQGRRWPRLSARDVANLVAFLNDAEG